jgi:hypothetical protein
LIAILSGHFASAGSQQAGSGASAGSLLFFDKSPIFSDQGIVAFVRFWADAHHHDW